MRLSVTGNGAQVLSRMELENRMRSRVIRRGLRNLGRGYIRDVTKKYLTGRKGAVGLNRVTGHLARGWSYVIQGSGDDQVLIVFNNVPYGKYHADDYEPKGRPRKNPPRLLAGAEWRSRTRGKRIEKLLDAAMKGEIAAARRASRG